MINLDDVSWNPLYAPEVDRPELDRVLIRMGGEEGFRHNLGTRLQKISDNQPLPDKNQKNIEEVVRQT